MTEQAAPPVTQPRQRRRGGVALGFAICALAACWNPVAAPFGLVAGVGAAVLGFRALRGAGSSRRLPAAAISLGALAAVASVVILVLTAGAVGVELTGEPIVKGRTAAELEQVLSQAAERTRAQRERAGKELDKLAGSRTGEERRSRGDGGATSPGSAGSNRP
jgi:hypothetical protein